MDIAIVGASCRFAKAKDIDSFWNNIVSQKNCIRSTPASRWVSDSNFSQWAGFIDDVDCFDADFFGISAREAKFIDPQQRIALESSWHCLENAGYQPKSLSGKDIGVFLATAGVDYKELVEKKGTTDAYEATGIHNSIAANRISYFYDWRGPSVVIDTACSSSLVAINYAIQAIETEECHSALVGGVNLLLTPTTFERFGQMGMLSSSGQCYAFDERANGYVRGEGVAFVYLKSLDQAVADKDNVLGIIKAIAINHGGAANTLTSPNAIAQSKVIKKALNKANIDPSTITYIETHGTGTPLGDPIEIAGLKRAFRRSKFPLSENFCALGSVKTNIGHLEPAAGMASVIKVLLALKHKQIPPNANFQTANPKLNIENSPFYIANQLQAWEPIKNEEGCCLPLRAGISSFGFGGVNGHLIIEEPVDVKSGDSTTKRCPLPLYSFDKKAYWYDDESHISECQLSEVLEEYLLDHQLGAHSMMPAAAYLSLMVADRKSVV